MYLLRVSDTFLSERMLSLERLKSGLFAVLYCPRKRLPGGYCAVQHKFSLLALALSVDFLRMSAIFMVRCTNCLAVLAHEAGTVLDTLGYTH